MMDRLDEWHVFVSVATKRSFVAAARAHGRSPQAITRAIAALEERLGTRLLHRTTRSVTLTHDGTRYLERCRDLLAEFDALESPSTPEAELRGTVSVAASVLFGQLRVMPIVGEFLRTHPGVDARVQLHDRVVSLAAEGVDVAVRLGTLPDSALRSQLVGHVRRVVVASPEYLRRTKVPNDPEALADHECIALTGITPIPDRWSFTSPGRRSRTVRVRARLVIDNAQAAIDAAIAGVGLVRVFSYQVDHLVAQERLRIVLRKHEPAPVPVHVVSLPGVPTRTAATFVELAVQRLRATLSSRM
jgi:DNA-binding transcriptional LysR family regulator